MSLELEERIEAYLEGRLCAEEAQRFERDLLVPEVATAFSQAIALREILKSAAPDRPPPDLVERIEQSLELDTSKAEKKSQRLRFPKVRLVLEGASWAVRGPALILPGMVNIREAVSGMGTIRYMLGSLDPLRQGRVKPKEKRARSLWSRVLRRGK